MNGLIELDPLVFNQIVLFVHQLFKLQNWNVCDKMEYIYTPILREAILKYILKIGVYTLQY